MTFPFLTVRALSDTPAPFYCHEEFYEPARSWIGRHIQWLHAQLVHPSASRRFLATLYVCTVVVVAVFTIIGIVGVLSLYARYRRVKALRSFSDVSSQAPKPIVPYVLIKSSTQSFNHVNEYVIERGFLWTKPIGSDSTQWQPLFFAGCEAGRRPISLSVDGARLCVLDDRDQIHVKQTLKEEWLGEQYYYADQSLDPNTWRGCGNAHIPQNSLWACSDRGVFNQQFSERVESLYIVGKAELSVGVPFPVPGSVHEPFIPLALSVSAGTAMVLGYSRTQTCGTTIDRLRLYTSGSDSSWIEHPFPTVSTDHVSVTKRITIVQTGQGERAKELRIMGTNSQGVTGMYIKRLTDMAWGFISLPLATLSDLVPYEEFTAEAVEPSGMVGYRVDIQ